MARTATTIRSVPDGFQPTGSIAISAFGPIDSSCNASTALSCTSMVDVDGRYVSRSFAPTQPGTYRLTAAHNADSDLVAVATACAGAGASVEGCVATPSITAVASAGVVLGGSVSDVATLAAGSSPTGTMTFSLFGPNDASCITAPAVISESPVSGNGPYSSNSFTPRTPGTYRFVASYSGDSNNRGATTGCKDNSELVVVQRASPVVSTMASATTAVGGVISDTALLVGGRDPTGTITFTVFAPGHSSCAEAPAFSSTVTIDGDGSYASDSFAAIDAGTYVFVASYGGDANNNGSTAACNDPNESVIVTTPVSVSTATTRPSATTTLATVTTVAPTTVAPTVPTTLAPTVPTVPPGTTSVPPMLTLSQPSVPPGGQISVRGNGCAPGSGVSLTIGTTTVGTSAADNSGSFSTTILVPDLPLGRVDVVAACGVTFVIPLEIAVGTRADTGAGTLGLFFFFFLLVLMIFRRRRLVRPRTTRQADGDGDG
jgi:uncharacterized protein (DUF2141 family)